MKQLKPIFFLILWLLLLGCTDGTPQIPDVEITFVAPSSSVVEETAVVTATVETAIPPPVSITITMPPAASLISPAAPSIPTPTLESSAAPAVCGPPAPWVVYTVKVGDTLFSLARRTGTTVAKIMQANCLSSDLIFAEQSLSLPFIPIPTMLSPSASPSVETPPPPPPTTIPAGGTPSPPVPPTSTATVEVPTAPSPGDPELVIVPFSGPIGTTHTISIQEFKPGEMVTLQIIFFTTQQVIFSFSTTVDEMGNGQVEITTTSAYLIGIYLVQAQGNMGTIADELFEVTQ